MRVSGVRRSWLTPESICVRCSIWRSRRERIDRKAAPARRTSSAPAGRKGSERPLPKASAASASARIGRTWLRRKTTATAVSRIAARIISTRSWCGFETDSRSRGTVASSTPSRGLDAEHRAVRVGEVDARAARVKLGLEGLGHLGAGEVEELAVDAGRERWRRARAAARGRAGSAELGDAQRRLRRRGRRSRSRSTA